MNTITVIPEGGSPSRPSYLAVAGDKRSTGSTVGQAIDGLRADLPETTLVIVQPMKPDDLFTAAQCQRLGELMAQWRAARDADSALPQAEQEELDALIRDELRAATERAARLLRATQS